MVASAAPMLASEPADSLPPTQSRSKTLWIKQLFKTGFHINDSTVDYPRFPKFCVKVYNWGDRVFNSYDPEYVVGTGRNWKLQGKSFNWLENYAFLFPERVEVWMRSNIYADIGGSLSFMAVSAGYMFNANELLLNNKDTRNNFNLNFTCALFNFDYTKTYTRGGAVISDLVVDRKATMSDIPFNKISNSTTSLSGTYFFGHRRFSHAAAYCFSKYQLKSAGSWMLGFSYVKQNLHLDFSGMPKEFTDQIPSDNLDYRFYYNDYVVTAGYGYNWAIRPRTWLFNITALQGIGYKHTRENSTDGCRSLVALNPTVMASLVYNHRALFVALQGKFAGRSYFNGDYTFFNSLTTALLTVGARF